MQAAELARLDAEAAAEEAAEAAADPYGGFQDSDEEQAEAEAPPPTPRSAAVRDAFEARAVVDEARAAAEAEAEAARLEDEEEEEVDPQDKHAVRAARKRQQEAARRAALGPPLMITSVQALRLALVEGLGRGVSGAELAALNGPSPAGTEDASFYAEAGAGHNPGATSWEKFEGMCRRARRAGSVSQGNGFRPEGEGQYYFSDGLALAGTREQREALRSSRRVVAAAGSFWSSAVGEEVAKGLPVVPPKRFPLTDIDAEPTPPSEFEKPPEERAAAAAAAAVAGSASAPLPPLDGDDGGNDDANTNSTALGAPPQPAGAAGAAAAAAAASLATVGGGGLAAVRGAKMMSNTEAIAANNTSHNTLGAYARSEAGAASRRSAKGRPADKDVTGSVRAK